MIDTQTMPTSVRRYFEQSDALERQGRPEEARQAMQMAVTELARTTPEFAALLVASAMGYREIEASLIEKHEYFERVKRTFLGFDCGEEFVPLTTTKTTTKRLVIK